MMKPITLILSVALAFLLFTAEYQNIVLMQQAKVIRLMMTNPCVPLTPAKPPKTGGNNG